MNVIHLTQVQRILNSHASIKQLGFFTKAGELVIVNNIVSLGRNRAAGTRRIKCLASGEIRQIRDSLIFLYNDLEVFI